MNVRSFSCEEFIFLHLTPSIISIACSELPRQSNRTHKENQLAGHINHAMLYIKHRLNIADDTSDDTGKYH